MCFLILKYTFYYKITFETIRREKYMSIKVKKKDEDLEKEFLEELTKMNDEPRLKLGCVKI